MDGANSISPPNFLPMELLVRGINEKISMAHDGSIPFDSNEPLFVIEILVARGAEEEPIVRIVNADRKVGCSYFLPLLLELLDEIQVNDVTAFGSL